MMTAEVMIEIADAAEAAAMAPGAVFIGAVQAAAAAGYAKGRARSLFTSIYLDSLPRH
jgi:2-methylcitrate dehydratase PrpD